jgi:ribosomal protein S18 acetylase RimI-like enzyme
MCFVIEPGRRDDADASAAARLIAETDVALFTFCGGGDLGVWVELSKWEWLQEDGVYCWAMSHVARLDGQLVGLLLSYSSRQHGRIDWSFRGARTHLAPERWGRVAAAHRLVPFLFPSIPEDAYYVQNLATHPSVRRRGLGHQLMELAFDRGRAEGCRSCHLDVDSSTAAVRFYENLGMRVLVKTEVPDIPGVTTHFRMVIDL